MRKHKQPVEILIEKFTKSIALPFQEILPSTIIEEVINDLGMNATDLRRNLLVGGGDRRPETGELTDN